MTLRTTALTPSHRVAGAKLVAFAGWEMPLHFGSQLEEHHAVRRDAGMFDVSHMQVVDIIGRGARTFLRRVLANDVDRLPGPGHALYSCLLNDSGGVLDDLIVYAIATDAYRLVLNAATAPADLDWLAGIAQPVQSNVKLIARPELAILAVQGPHALERCFAVITDLAAALANVPRFGCTYVRDYFIARTGYTGEDGCEILLPAQWATWLWDALAAAGVHPCGLGARDTLRLEAGLNLYGQDMDAATSPYACGLGWTVHSADDREFVGRAALAAQAVTEHQVGLVLLAPGVLRAHQAVHSAHGEGHTTSGSFAPTLNKSIAFARVPRGVAVGDTVEVAIRDKRLPARVVKPRFVRHGQNLLDV
mgnify:CR=1 FL=1